MFKYLGKRAITYVVMAFIATSVAFLISCSYFKPGESMAARQDAQNRKTPEQINASLAALGLDPNRPVILRYFDWLKNVFTRFDWGRSPNGQAVGFEFGNRVWISFALTIVTVILTIIIGITLGVFTAARQYKASDRIITGYSYMTYIIPIPVAYFLVQLGFIWMNQNLGTDFKVTDVHDPTITVENSGVMGVFLDYAAHYVPPTTAMTLLGWAGYQTSQRQFLLDNINADFVRTARATGLTRLQAIRKHALRVSFIPTAQSIAFTIPQLFTGSFFAESIFNWPGLGRWSIGAIGQQDVMVATAMCAYGAMIFAIGAMLADFATTLVDPRVRMS